MTLDDQGRLGLGTVTPGDWHGNANQFVISKAGSCGLTIDSTSSTESSIYFGDGSTGNEAYRGFIEYSNNGDNMSMGASASTCLQILGSNKDVRVHQGNLVIGTAGKGIDFSNQTASSATGATTTAELLDHYEEGTWTPVDGSGVGLTFANTSGNCIYTRIGRIVIASFRVTFPSNSNTQTAVIGGLPFNCIGMSHNGHGAALGEHTDESSTTMVMQQSNNTMLILHCNNGVDVRQNNECSGEDYRGSVVYQTA